MLRAMADTAAGPRARRHARGVAAALCCLALVVASTFELRTGTRAQATASPAVAPESAAVQAPRARPVDVGPGRLLVAARGLPDQNFSRALVLLVDHGPGGSMGLVVNEPIQMPLARLFRDLPFVEGEGAPVFLGGPVQTSIVMALIRSAAPVADARHVVDDIHLAQSSDIVRQWVATGSDPSRVRVFLGYSGWGPGQLEGELTAGVWHVLDADADAVFDPEPDTAWDRQIRRTEQRRASREPQVGPSRIALAPAADALPDEQRPAEQQ